MSSQRPGAHRGVVTLLLLGLVVLTSACQSAPTMTEQWTPPYLQLHLYAGKAQVRWSDTSEWMTLKDGASITIEEKAQIIADAVEGALFYLGDGSTLELAPETIVEVQNPHTFPRLQVVLQDGTLLFVAQKPSYEFVTPVYLVKLLNVPSRIRIEITDETTRLTVEEGAVTCALETETFTLPACRDMYVRSGEEPEITEFCTFSTAASPTTPTPSPSPTPREAEPTATPSPSPSPSPTLTPTPRPRPTLAYTPAPPTDTPLPPPPPPDDDKDKDKPPPPPPPTDTPPPPPPTDTPPPPPPTDPPPPPPTDTPPRPTLEPPRPTTSASG